MYIDGTVAKNEIEKHCHLNSPDFSPLRFPSLSGLFRNIYSFYSENVDHLSSGNFVL